MNDADLQALIAGPESDRVERKESARGEAGANKVRQAICAFANDLANHRQPSIVIIGQRDDGSNSGNIVDDSLLKNLAGMRADGAIAPFPTIDVRKVATSSGDVAVVIVHPSSSPPVGYDGRIYVRVGPTRRVATAEEERRLVEKRRLANLPFDLHPVDDASTDDLDLELFTTTYLPHAVAADVLAQNQRTTEERLKALRMLAPNGSPTVVGILALGKAGIPQ